MFVNMDYKSNLYKNKIPVLTSKVNKEVEQTRVQGKVEDDRRYAVEAAIIKVMKTNNQIEYQNLVSDTVKLLQSKF